MKELARTGKTVDAQMVNDGIESWQMVITPYATGASLSLPRSGCSRIFHLRG
jgi:hypothetical protein